MDSWSHTCHFETKIILYDHICLNFQLLEDGITDFKVFSAKTEQKYPEYPHFPLIQKYFTPFIGFWPIDVSKIIRHWTPGHCEVLHNSFGSLFWKLKYLHFRDFSVNLPKIG